MSDERPVGRGGRGASGLGDIAFFFFKQQTAYEISVRDWSSDVCSSDLGRDIHGGHVTPAAGEKDAVAPFPAAELEHPGAGHEQRTQHPRERGRSRTQDVFVRPPRIFERPRAPRRHVSRQRALATTSRSTASSTSVAGSTARRLRIKFTAAFSSPSTLGSSGSPPRLRPTTAWTIPSLR